MAENNLLEFTHAQLSLAAYATLSSSLNRDQYIAALQASNVGFTHEQAEQFVATYRVLDHRPNTLGFSATVFQRVEGGNDVGLPILAIRGTEPTLSDLASDALIGLFGTSTLQPQYGALTDYLRDLTVEGGLLDGKNFTVAGHSLGGYLASALTGNTTYKNQIDHVYAYNAPGTGGVLLQWLNILGLNVDSVNGAKITNSNAYNGLSFIAGFGTQRGALKDIFIEADPNPLSIHNHSIVTLTDSLAMYNLFAQIDPSVSANLSTVTGILNAAASGYRGSLEQTLFDLRTLFQSSPGSLTPDTPLLGDVDREAYYIHVGLLSTFLTQAPPGTYQLTSLVDQPTGSVLSQAQQDSGIAYRYALKELNPFVITSPTPPETNALYAQHNQQSELDLVNETTGAGALTVDYLRDRELFLREKIALNVADQTTSSGNIHFADYVADSDEAVGVLRYQIETGVDVQTDQEFLFGSNGIDRLEGRSNDDHLYGGEGVDLLIGNAGNDYLQGDGGGDQLDGGSGVDTLVGGQGNDLLEGGTENDTLDGGIGNDILKGGSGLDTYRIRASDGADTIEDSDGKGVVEFDGKILIGGLRRNTDPANVFRSADGTLTYTKQGNNLVVTGSGPLTIKNFATGLFGIRLFGEADYAATTRDTFLKTVPDPNNPPPATIQVAFFDEGNNHSNYLEDPLTDGTNNLIHALGGTDTIISGAGDDQLYGDGGSDEIYGGLGNDRLYGGSEGDQLFGDNVAVSTSGGNDYLDGGDGNDLLQGGAGRDLVFGGAGNDNLNGDEFAGDNAGGFDDYLDGGADDDELHGAAGSDVLIGGMGNDLLIGDTTQFQNGTPEQGGNDSLDGGDGQDRLFGLYGDDLLLGGKGNDLVNGQDGSDVLYGGEGDDTLSGDLRFTSLTGGYDTREWRAAGGDDLLFGEAGTDLLSGGEGNDVLEGGTANDRLYGDYITSQVSASDPLYWTLFSAIGDDWLSGGAGNDALSGGFGADVLVGGEGFDVLAGGAGDDTLEGGAGDDVLYGEYAFGQSEFLFNPGPSEFFFNPFFSAIRALSGNDVLNGGDGNDNLRGGEGSDVLLGGAGNDLLVDDEPGYSVAGGNDTLYGGDGNDMLESWMGDDELHGGGGNDSLISLMGSDILYGDDGDDRLGSAHESGGTEAVTLIGGLGNDGYWIDGLGDIIVVEAAGEGIDSVISNISYTLADNFENLLLGGLATSGVGNSLDNVMSGAKSLEGLGGNDTLTGGGRLDGGAGNDVLQGWSGISFFNEETGQLEYLANSYVFGPGFGQDRIIENDAVFNAAYYQNEDRVSFAAGIVPSDVTWERVGNDLVLNLSGGTDRISIPSFYDLRFERGGYLVNGVTVPPQGIVSAGGGFPAYTAPSRIEHVQFADGTGWNAAHFGAPLLGDWHADTYDFGLGSGEVTVIDFDFATSLSSEPDTLRIGAGVAATDLSVSRVGDDLALSVNGTTDRLAIQSFFKTVTVIPPFSFRGYSVAPYRIEQVQFADGTVWTVSDLINRISMFAGTTGADTLFGNQNDNLIQGLGGDDYLSGQGGNDVLDGGAGNDRLFGDAGNDTYLFGRGGGQDILVSYDATGTETEVVHLGSDVLPSDVTIQVVGTSNDLVLRINGTSDQLVLDEFLWRSDYQIDRLEFGDGTVWDSAMILDRALGLTLIGTDGDNTLRGSMLGDMLVGLGGNDTLVGNEGDDQLVSGPGDDILSGDAGDDTYVFNLGDGVDTIYDEVVPGEANQIVFGAGIAQSDLAFVRDEAARTLTIQVGGSTDELQLIDFDPTGAEGSLVVQTLLFADGSTLNLADLFPSNQAPTVANPLADQTVPEDAPFSLVVPATTFADPDAGDVRTYSATLAGGAALPTWLSFDPATRMFSGTPLNSDVGTLNLDVTATDSGGLTVTDTFALAIQNVNDAPALATPLLDQTAAEDSPFSCTVPSATFADEDVGDALTYSATLAGGAALPTWLSFDPVTRAFSGTPLNGDVGSLDIAVTATDAGGLSATDQFALAIQNVNDAPAVANPIADQTKLEDAPLSIVIPANTFADQDAGDTLTYTASLANGAALPSWLSFTAATRTFTGTPDDAQVGSLDLRVTATDTGNLTVSDQFTLTVTNVNEAPTVAAPLADQQATEDAPFNLVVPATTFADQDLGDVLTYSATLAGGAALPSWLSFNATTRTFTGTPLNGDVGNLNIALKAADLGGLSVTNIFALTVQNVNDAPIVATPVADQQVTQGTAFSLVVAANTFADQDVGDVLSYGATLANGAALPAWLSFNSTTRTFNGTPGAGDTGIVNIKLTATDTGSLSVSDLFDLTVQSQDQILTGTAGNDVLTGGAGHDQLFGLAGNDQLIGAAGSDLLDGGTGADTMQGGAGDDTYVVDVASDVVTELANEGADTVQSSLLVYTLGANVENLTLTGTGPSGGIGNTLNNMLIGNSGANLLDGKAGADQMSGGAGDDLYIVDHVGDTVVELAGEGALDSVTSAVTYSLSAHVENLVLRGSAAINGTGNDLGNVLTGNSAANVLTGLGGNDTYVIGVGDTVVEAASGGADTVVSGVTHALAANVEHLTLVGFSAINGTGNALDNVLNGVLNLAGNTLTGGAGNDTYILGAGDTVVEAANGGTDTVQAGFSYTLGPNVENLTLTGIGAINGTGNSLANVLTGNSAANTLTGAAGNDTVSGGQGNDVLNGGTGNDTYLFNRGDGQDTVQDTDATVGNADRLLYGATINPLDLVLSRQVNDLRIAIHGTTDQVTVQNWYSTPTTAQVEDVQAGNGQHLLNTQVDQLIQAMATFSAQTGLTWDQAIDQRPQDVQTVLAASWQ